VRHAGPPLPRPRRAILLLALSLGSLAVALVALLAVLHARVAPADPAMTAHSSTGSGRTPDAVAVLRGWDARRATAWADGDAAALAALYVPGSGAGAADLTLLRRYADRGLRVRGMTMQLLRVDVRRESPDRLRLLVTDRLTGAVATRGGTRLDLPGDVASRRWLTLRRVDGVWLVDRVWD